MDVFAALMASPVFTLILKLAELYTFNIYSFLHVLHSSEVKKKT